MPKRIDRTQTQAAIANSLTRAASLCIDEPIMRRYADREDPEAYLLVEAWQPARAFQRFITYVEAL